MPSASDPRQPNRTQQPASRPAQPGQRRLCRKIHVPQVVVNGLVAPRQFPGSGIQRQNRAGITFLFRCAITAPDIWRGHAHRQIDQIQLRVIGRWCPRVW